MFSKDSSNFSYLLGYYLADGYSQGTKNALVYFDTKDSQLAQMLVSYFGGEYKSVVKTVQTGTNCLMYRANISREASVLVHSCEESYKGLFTYYLSLSFSNQCSFIHGLFDGDGSISDGSSYNKGIMFYSSQFDVDKILENFFTSIHVNYSFYKDKRGFPISVYHIGSYQNLVQFYKVWNSSFCLNRKFDLLCSALNRVVWFKFSVDGEIKYSSNRKLICSHINRNASYLSLASKKGSLPLASKVPFNFVDKSKII